MGLRINTNTSAIRALRNLRVNDRNQSRSLERLSTGLRINRGSDDPSGLIISELLRSQLKALDQAVSNSQNASNLISIADAALQEASDLLVAIQDSIVFAQNTGGASPDQIAAEQDAVDQAINAIDRIANTTRYADRTLLNGDASYQQLSGVSASMQNVDLRSVTFPGAATERTLTVNVETNPQRAMLNVTGASAVGTTTIRVTGTRGTQDIVVASSANSSDIAGAINNVAGFTGVFASGGGNNLTLRTEEFGASELIKMQVVNGSLYGDLFQFVDNSSAAGEFANFDGISGGGIGTTTILSDFGRDGQVSFAGQLFTGVGRDFDILANNAQFSFQLNPDVMTEDDGGISALVSNGGNLSFTVSNTGLAFQLNERALPTDRLEVGIRGINTNTLGYDIHRDFIAEAEGGQAAQVTRGGFLSTIRTGQGNDLFQDPGNAQGIVEAAITEVASLRGFLGAVQADAIEPNIDSVGVAIENISASLADLRDLDFAEETANFTKTQILFQSGIAVLASANLIPQSILTLLG